VTRIEETTSAQICISSQLVYRLLAAALFRGVSTILNRISRLGEKKAV
jgi:hypothetical protein